jgi:3-oxoacyl-[acyl-carrier-protein] synthase II
MGIISPIGNDVPSFWQNLLNGKSGIGPITAFDSTDFSVQIAGEIKNLDPLAYLNPKECNRMDRFTILGMIAAQQALEDSGLLSASVPSERIGVLTGSGIGGIATLEDQHRTLLEKGPRAVSPLFIPMMISDIFSGHIAMRWGFNGLNYSVVSACATASHALGIAFQHIRVGDADVIVTGGTEASITPLSVAGFARMKALSTRNAEPEKASRPFDIERDGFVVGEGAGIVVLEELQHALKRNAPIYAELIGYGFTADAYHITAPHPEGLGATQAIENAIRMSGLPKTSFKYINAHGTSTPLNDKYETLAIKKVFGKLATELNISSTKSMTGHLLGAAGSVEFIALVLALRHQIVPPTINYEYPDPDCDLNYTPNKAQKLSFSAGLSNNFGFGGHNAVLAAKIFE